MNDQHLRLISPPLDSAVTMLDTTVGNRLIGVCAVIILAAIFVAIREWKKSGSPILLLIIIGGALTNLAEPLVDHNGACWYPLIGQQTLFELMTRPMPLFLLFPYIAYFGVLTMILYHVFSKGASTRTMWLWFLLPLVADIILEETLLSLSDNLYIYYGNQPLQLHKFPFWWTATNSMGAYLSAVVLTMFKPILSGWKVSFSLVCTLLCYSASLGLVGMPSIVVIHSNYSFWVTQFGGIATFLIAFLVVHGCTRLIAIDSHLSSRV